MTDTTSTGGTPERLQDAMAWLETIGPVGVVRYFNPPEGLIAVKGALQLCEVIAAALADEGLAALVLAGAQEGVFIRHADVGQILRAGEAVADGKTDAASFASSPFAQVGALLDRARKPVIAAIEGVCMGGGFEIALACTLRVASHGAGPIGLPEIRIGLFPGSGGITRLSRVVGPHRARRFILLGKTLSAQEAFVEGLLDELADDALTRALEIAQGLVTRDADAIAAILELTGETGDSDDITKEIQRFGKLVGESSSVRDRMRAFLSEGVNLDIIE